MSCYGVTTQCEGKVHVARRLPSSALIFLFRAKSQSALIMLLETQIQGSTFRHARTEGMLYMSRCWGCGSVRAKARLKDRVCATCGRAVSSPDTTPLPFTPQALESMIMEKPTASGAEEEMRKIQLHVCRCGASELCSSLNAEKWPLSLSGSSVQYCRNWWLVPGTELGTIQRNTINKGES